MTLDRRLLPGVTAAAAFAATILCGADARASGYLTARYGADQGAPMMPNTFAIYFNPAALGGTKGTTLTGDMSILVRQAHYTRTNDALSPNAANRDRLLADPKYVSANTGDANLLNVIPLPFLGVSTDFGTKSFRAGYAVYFPFGGVADWSRDNRGISGVPGASDGAQRWQNISGQIWALYNTFALSYVVGDTGLSFGLSVSPVISHVETVRARTADDSDEIESANGSLKEGRSLLNVTGVNVAGSVGAYWQSEKGDIRVGLAYLTQPGFGTTRMKGTLDGRTPGGDVHQDVDMLQAWPDIVRLGGAYRLPNTKVELRADGEFVRWSTLDKQCVVVTGKNCNVQPSGAEAAGSNDIVLNIPRNWKNAGGVRAGVGYFVNDDLQLSGSAQFTTSAVPKETIDANAIDSFRLYGNIGAIYRVMPSMAVGANYTHIYFFPVDTKGASNSDQLQKPSQSPSADGKYTSQIGILNVNVAYTF